MTPINTGPGPPGAESPRVIDAVGDWAGLPPTTCLVTGAT